MTDSSGLKCNTALVTQISTFSTCLNIYGSANFHLNPAKYWERTGVFGSYCTIKWSNVCFSPSSLSTVCHERPSEFCGSQQQWVCLLLCIHIVKHNKFWRQQVENQTMWCEGGAWRVISPTGETAGSLKCTTAQLNINFDCQFVVCAACCFE